MVATENQRMLQPASGLDSLGAQFMDYPQMTSLPNTYNSGGHHGLDMVFLTDTSHVA